ncbi:hypothetical protein [Nostoc sp. NZL]|uniref:hypothetical protein n=1 Tax=Nostoc sp. NZL TaxID=2650612 RepID=UPI0018C581F1|nr:hypothetical protein [Nostoc sp. NZL]MBG1239806.1 hypothetical protein [Nostoc sp. NZL]
MSENTKSQNHQWFRDLSEKEQQTLAAGQIPNIPNEGMPAENNFFIQQTNIQTTAENTLKLANGDVSSQNTRYIFSQFTLGSSMKIWLPNFPSFRNKANDSIVN